MRLIRTLAALTACLAIANAEAEPASVPAAKNVVLVHGLFADGSSWGKVIPLLLAQGLTVTSVQNPLTSFADDVAATQRALDLQDGPTVLVGHSYAGMVITQAGVDPKVSALVYVAARGPEANEDYPALVNKFPAAPASAGVRWDAHDFGRLTETAFINDFVSDLPKEEARAVYATQQPYARAIGSGRNTVAAWHEKPSWYVVAKNDRTVNPDLERFMAKRMNAQTIELPSGHVPMLSRPADIADVILKAAAAR